MSTGLAQRQLVLAGVALLAAVVALAIAGWGDADDSARGRSSVPVVGSGWYYAVAAPYRPAAGKQSACRVNLRADTNGVAHPVLPCGAKIVLSFEDREVVTEVIDRGPSVPGRDFDVTAALAVRLGLTEQAPVKWRFAR